MAKSSLDAYNTASKGISVPVHGRNETTRGSISVRRYFLSLTLALLSAYFLIPRFYEFLISSQTHPDPFQNSYHAETSFSWDDIEPSEELQWYPCFEPYLCARLSVPLDWNSTLSDGGPRLALAVIKRPAAVGIEDPRYEGPVIFNPGGPGNSGVRFLLHFGAAIEALLDPDIPLGDSKSAPAKYFDLVSFDPRGVNNTTPHHNCIASPSARNLWKAQGSALGSRLSNPETFAQVFAREKLYGKICSLVDNGGREPDVGHIGQYMSTANVVRDMVELVERHGQWREKAAMEAATELKESLPGAGIQDMIERTRWRRGEEELQYWGLSYGTVIGQMFATMQPHRVKRMILDGNVNVDDYINGQWESNLRDTDKITLLFADACFGAGPDKCKIWHQEGSEKILANMNATLEGLKLSPVTRIGKDGSPEIVTYSDIVHAIFMSWYNAFWGFTAVADLLAGLETDDSSFAPITLEPDGLRSNETVSTTNLDRDAAGLVTRCTDAQDLTSMTKPQFMDHVLRVKDQSNLFGEGWSTIPLPCTGYSVRAKWRFTGPVGGKTNKPILFLSARLDPVTPLTNAVASSNLFPGSQVISSDAVGHSTISMPSVAVLIWVRRYLATGSLPENPSSDYSSSVKLFDNERKKPDSIDERIWKAILTLADGIPRALW